MASESRSILDLPDHLNAEIFLRLPTLSIFACNCVCRSWRHLISSDSHLADQHLSRLACVDLLVRFRTHSSASSALCFVDFEQTFVNLGLRAEIKVNSFFNIPNLAEQGYDVVNSCRGLLCLYKIQTPYDSNRDGYKTPCIICNPILGEYVNLPKPINSQNLLEILAPFRAVSALGFCQRTDQYKVVRVFLDLGGRTEIYLLGSDSWRSIGDAPVSPQCELSCPTLVDGFVNWFCEEGGKGPKSILYFDFDGEVFGEIPVPAHFTASQREQMVMGVLGGCLYVTARSPDYSLEIWVMKEYGNGESWSKELVVDASLTRRVGPELQPVRYLGNGEILFYRGDVNFVSYHPQTIAMRQILVSGPESSSGGKYELIFHSPSFVSLKDGVRGGNMEVKKARPRADKEQLPDARSLSVISQPYKRPRRRFRI